MKTKPLMITSSFVLALFGISATFFPSEILLNLDQTPNELLILFVQIAGALYFGFGIMNWIGKNVLFGGIYGKPLCIGNLSHFGIAGLALLKSAMKSSSVKYIWIVTIVYLIFAILFGITFFTNPKLKNN